MLPSGRPFTILGATLWHDSASFSESELSSGLALSGQVEPSLFRLQTCDITPASAFAWQPVQKDLEQWRNGTGFLIAPGLIATASHVSAGCEERLTCLSALYGKTKSTVKAVDAEKDLALLSIPVVTDGGLPMRPTDEPLQMGELCFALGFPMDFQDYDSAPTLIVSPGRYGGIRPMNAGGVCFASDVSDDLSRDVYHFDMVAINGHSGSPVIDLQGRVVGLFVASFAWHNKSFVQPLVAPTTLINLPS